MKDSKIQMQILIALGLGIKRNWHIFFGIIAGIIVGVLLTAICLIFATPIMKACGATKGTIDYLTPYYMVLSTI